jgi:hypothetical protein
MLDGARHYALLVRFNALLGGTTKRSLFSAARNPAAKR